MTADGKGIEDTKMKELFESFSFLFSLLCFHVVFSFTLKVQN